MRKQTKKVNPLVGKFFHSMEADGETIVWQGEVLSHVGGSKDLYLLQTYDWFIGLEMPDQELVSVDQMAGWKFYDSIVDMNNYYETYSRRLEMREKAAAQGGGV